MVFAIVKKELRETLAMAALALGLSVIYVSQLMGKESGLFSQLLSWVPGMEMNPPDVPFVQDDFWGKAFLIGVTLAIALGFRQSAWEPSQGTALYLLHLPLRRRTIFLTKIVTGISLLLVCTLLPIVTYATWASLPRTHPGPFEWMMTGPAFRLWLLMPLVYLGAFASGIRPARWFGSRLMPLAAAALPAILAYVMPYWWLCGVPLLLIAAGVLVSDILWEAETRDF